MDRVEDDGHRRRVLHAAHERATARHPELAAEHERALAGSGSDSDAVRRAPTPRRILERFKQSTYGFAWRRGYDQRAPRVGEARGERILSAALALQGCHHSSGDTSLWFVGRGGESLAVTGSADDIAALRQAHEIHTSEFPVVCRRVPAQGGGGRPCDEEIEARWQSALNEALAVAREAIAGLAYGRPPQPNGHDRIPQTSVVRGVEGPLDLLDDRETLDQRWSEAYRKVSALAEEGLEELRAERGAPGAEAALMLVAEAARLERDVREGRQPRVGSALDALLALLDSHDAMRRDREYGAGGWGAGWERRWMNGAAAIQAMQNARLEEDPERGRRAAVAAEDDMVTQGPGSLRFTRRGREGTESFREVALDIGALRRRLTSGGRQVDDALDAEVARHIEMFDEMATFAVPVLGARPSVTRRRARGLSR